MDSKNSVRTRRLLFQLQVSSRTLSIVRMSDGVGMLVPRYFIVISIWSHIFIRDFWSRIGTSLLAWMDLAMDTPPPRLSKYIRHTESRRNNSCLDLAESWLVWDEIGSLLHVSFLVGDWNVLANCLSLGCRSAALISGKKAPHLFLMDKLVNQGNYHDGN